MYRSTVKPEPTTTYKYRPVVNFTSILRADFPAIFIGPKSIKPNFQYSKALLLTFVRKKLFIKCWWNDTSGQFRQHFINRFYANVLAPIKALILALKTCSFDKKKLLKNVGNSWLKYFEVFFHSFVTQSQQPIFLGSKCSLVFEMTRQKD